MKNIIISIFALISLSSAFAADKIEASNASELSVLDLVLDVHRTYSKTSELEAKVVEVLAGDGMNATRMILILNTGYHDTKLFELGDMMVAVKRITFLAKDVVVINYIQDSFDNAEDMNPIQINKSVTIQVLRNADGTLANEIKILK